MTVNFYPPNPIDSLEEIIKKEDGLPLYGEIEIYRKLFHDLNNSNTHWYIWHDLKLPGHSDTSNYYKKTSAQIDFLILCEQGILILEVKGGPISFKDNTFFYGRKFEKPMKQNPFKQAEGYKFTLKDKILNNVKKTLFCDAVAFPHVDYEFRSKIIDEKLLWTPYLAKEYDGSIEKFILHVFNYIKEKHKKYSRYYNKLSVNELTTIKKTLSPIISNRNRISTINTLEWLEVNNLEILEGLLKNQRIMIEGPPGSGKTTIAKAFIDKHRDKEGIYICWNNFLMYLIRSKLRKRQLNNIEVTTLFRFVLKNNPKGIDYKELISLDEESFYNLVKDTLANMKEENKLKTYDYIVIDEAQDLFDRGIDIFIDNCSGFNKDGLKNGNSLILYDIDQSYSISGRNVSEISDILTDYYCHFKLDNVKRSAQNPEIRELSEHILDNPEILYEEQEHFAQIKIFNHKDLQELKKHVVKNILIPIRQKDSSLKGEDCIILIESRFLKENYRGENIRELFIIKDMEELNEENIGDTANKLRYTSILKFKGLEKKNVFLIILAPCESNKYEIFVGITRAILNLEINIIQS